MLFQAKLEELEVKVWKNTGFANGVWSGTEQIVKEFGAGNEPGMTNL